MIIKHGTGIITGLLIVLSVSADYTPAECRAAGVAVPDGAEIRGVIVEENYGTVSEVSARCQSPFTRQKGCALVVWPGTPDTPSEWVLWAVDEEVMLHESCHALYVEGDHL